MRALFPFDGRAHERAKFVLKFLDAESRRKSGPWFEVLLMFCAWEGRMVYRRGDINLMTSTGCSTCSSDVFIAPFEISYWYVKSGHVH